jgi:hypothetical protein
MMKIVINKCFGGFGLSELAIARYCELTGLSTFDEYEVRRDDLILVQVVEELGESACSRFSDLKVVEIPDGVEWQVKEYDGKEWISEVHRTWD